MRFLQKSLSLMIEKEYLKELKGDTVAMFH